MHPVSRHDSYSCNERAMSQAQPQYAKNSPILPSGAGLRRALLPAGGTGTGAGWFDGLLGNGKEAWNNNKDWLVGDKSSIGAIPLGLGLFNAFNQYTQGRESIKSMREQNALARESFELNKKGALASLEDQYNKRNSNDMYHRNPNLSYSDNVAAASSKTLEDMKRFK